MEKINFKLGDKVEIVRLDNGDPLVIGDIYLITGLYSGLVRLDHGNGWHVTHDQIKRV